MLLEPELYEKTIQCKVSFEGIGLFTGEKAHVALCPAAAGTGVVFRRVDLPGRPDIPALLHSVVASPRCTKLGVDGASVQMVEHLLSAVLALGVDNLLVEVSGPEIPAMDGSSLAIVQALEKAGLMVQQKERRRVKIQAPIFWSQGDVHLVALPSDQLRISYTLHYPQSALIGSQFYSFALDVEKYKTEIAPCRTFSLYEEIAPLIEKGFIKGGGLENALVVKDNQIMNTEGARFSDEMVRHKVLDLMGDLALLGFPLSAHIIALRSGHASHVAFAKQILSACPVKEESEVFSNSYVLENC